MQHQCVGGHAELGSFYLEAVSQQFPADTSLELIELQLARFRGEARAHLRELYVGGHFRGLAFLQRGPESHRTDALRQLDWKLNPLAPGRNIGVIELRKQLTVPLRQSLRRAAGQIATNVERRGELFGRHRTQSEAMMRAKILETEIDVGKRQQGGLPQIVLPLDGGAVDDDFVLA